MGFIRKKTELSTEPVADRPDKNWMPQREHGRSKARAPRGTHQIKHVNTTAPKDL